MSGSAIYWELGWAMALAPCGPRPRGASSFREECVNGLDAAALIRSDQRFKLYQQSS
jgi:hypothetical protein